jgi:thiol-disulfide isomerase/thioredoxin
VSSSLIVKIFLVAFFLFYGLISAAQNIESVKYDQLKTRVNYSNDTLYVLNFWATWCKPCVQELPYFEKYNEDYKNKPLKIILVNLDFNSQVKTTAEPFIEKKKIRSSVVHITDTDADSWINKVDSNWSGAIPATSMYLHGKKIFFKEGSMTSDELKNELDRGLNR